MKTIITFALLVSVVYMQKPDAGLSDCKTVSGQLRKQLEAYNASSCVPKTVERRLQKKTGPDCDKMYTDLVATNKKRITASGAARKKADDLWAQRLTNTCITAKAPEAKKKDRELQAKKADCKDLNKQYQTAVADQRLCGVNDATFDTKLLTGAKANGTACGDNCTKETHTCSKANTDLTAAYKIVQDPACQGAKSRRLQAKTRTLKECTDARTTTLTNEKTKWDNWKALAKTMIDLRTKCPKKPATKKPEVKKTETKPVAKKTETKPVAKKTETKPVAKKTDKTKRNRNLQGPVDPCKHAEEELSWRRTQMMVCLSTPGASYLNAVFAGFALILLAMF